MAETKYHMPTIIDAKLITSAYVGIVCIETPPKITGEYNITGTQKQKSSTMTMQRYL